MGKYINIDRISAETHAHFDAFAAGIMADTMRELNVPNQELACGMDDQCTRKLQHWVNAGLLNTRPGQAWSALDVAMATVFTVLKKRGLAMGVLRQIRDGLNLPMYEELSVLGAAVLMCRPMDSWAGPSLKPYLVIDGENRISLCLAQDVALLLDEPEISTYSQLIVNLRRVMQECDFIYKTKLMHEMDFSELPAQIAVRLLDSNTKRFSIDREHGRIKTVSNGGTDPKYGERIIKYAAGRVVSDTVTTVESLNE